MDYHRTLPFYMTYKAQNMMPPTRKDIKNNSKDMFDYMRMYSIVGQMEEQDAMQDLEYLQQQYPAEIKKYQRKINDILDKYDYPDSMIYDEYPDRIALSGIEKSIIESLKRERNNTDEKEKKEINWDEIEYLVLILLYYEIYKRRRKAKRIY